MNEFKDMKDWLWEQGELLKARLLADGVSVSEMCQSKSGSVYLKLPLPGNDGKDYDIRIADHQVGDGSPSTGGQSADDRLGWVNLDIQPNFLVGLVDLDVQRDAARYYCDIDSDISLADLLSGEAKLFWDDSDKNPRWHTYELVAD